ncbi:MAG: S-layer homology domain-containing protein [Oscillibacter sp.]|nr:S-layer homology domain-containing protein [Oscillibacter sp.]
MRDRIHKRIHALLMSLVLVAVPVLVAESESAPPEPTPEPVAEVVETVSPFEDVKADSPFLPGILYAVEQNITNGTTAKTFTPYAICTHAQILTFLWRASGSPASNIDNPFPADIETNAYYYPAALWSYEKGLIDDTFNPYAYCTRLQAVTYMWKLSGAPAAYGDGFAFTDVPDDPDALNAVAWAIAHSVTNGTTETTFSPSKRCTRAQIVTFIYRGRDLLGSQA